MPHNYSAIITRNNAISYIEPEKKKNKKKTKKKKKKKKNFRDI
jgi:hypothetical protein